MNNKKYGKESLLIVYVKACAYPNPGLVKTILEKSKNEMINYVSHLTGFYVVYMAMYKNVPFSVLELLIEFGAKPKVFH